MRSEVDPNIESTWYNWLNFHWTSQVMERGKQLQSVQLNSQCWFLRAPDDSHNRWMFVQQTCHVQDWTVENPRSTGDKTVILNKTDIGSREHHTMSSKSWLIPFDPSSTFGHRSCTVNLCGPRDCKISPAVMPSGSIPTCGDMLCGLKSVWAAHIAETICTCLE